MADRNKQVQNKQERVYKSMQLLGPECLNEWVRLRVRTNEGIWFMPTDLSQLSRQQVTGQIRESDYIRSSCENCVRRWIRLTLETEKYIRFYPTRYSGEYIIGRINTNDYISAVCPPLPAIPTNLTGTWETNYGLLYLRQVDPYLIEASYSYDSVYGRISYATPWGYDLYGQWLEGSRIGRFKWTIAPNGGSFTGTWGSGDNFEGGGTWSGTKLIQ